MVSAGGAAVAATLRGTLLSNRRRARDRRLRRWRGLAGRCLLLSPSIPPSPPPHLWLRVVREESRPAGPSLLSGAAAPLSLTSGRVTPFPPPPVWPPLLRPASCGRTAPRCPPRPELRPARVRPPRGGGGGGLPARAAAVRGRLGGELTKRQAKSKGLGVFNIIYGLRLGMFLSFSVRTCLHQDGV